MPHSLTEVHKKLLNNEVRLQDVAPNNSLPISANVAHTRPPNNKNNNRNNSSGYRGNNWYNNRINNTWQQYPSRQENTSRGYHGKCQICGVFGHSAHMFPQMQQSGGYVNSTPGHYSSSPMPWQPLANMAATSYNPNNWILDSGATHHLVTDLNNHVHQPNNRGEEVIIADGAGLPITHIGSSIDHKNFKGIFNIFCNLKSL